MYINTGLGNVSYTVVLWCVYVLVVFFWLYITPLHSIRLDNHESTVLLTALNKKSVRYKLLYEHIIITQHPPQKEILQKNNMHHIKYCRIRYVNLTAYNFRTQVLTQVLKTKQKKNSVKVKFASRGTFFTFIIDLLVIKLLFSFLYISCFWDILILLDVVMVQYNTQTESSHACTFLYHDFEICTRNRTEFMINCVCIIQEYNHW
jgi:hypothetical protein